MGNIKFYGLPGRMNANITNVPGFEGDVFSLNFPESIGASHDSKWHRDVVPSWEELDNGNWQGRGTLDGVLEYSIKVSIHRRRVNFV